MYTEKIRIYPNKSQRTAIDEILWNCKELYNYLLELNIKKYKESKEHLLGYDFDKYAKEFIGNKIPSRARQNVNHRLTVSFTMFFRKHHRFPKFKSINQYRSFTVITRTKGFNFDKNHVWVNGVPGKMKAVITRDLLGIPKQCTIKKMRSGKYYAFIDIDDKNIEKVTINHPKDRIAIDLGVSRFFTDNKGHYVAAPKFLRRNLKKLAKAQRELSRKQKGSKNREKARIKYARMCEKVANTRRDFHYKVAYYLVTTYKEIICEDLHIKQMFPGKSKKYRLARRALYDIGLGEFLIILQQMADLYGCKLIKVDPKYTSQMCCNCGTIVHKNLSDRIHKCPHCGLKIDRDINAAINILQKGKNIPVGTTAGTKIPVLVEISIPGTDDTQQAE